MKKKISIIAAIAILTAATAFASPGDQTGDRNGFEQMYQYCNKVMQQWGSGNQQPQSSQDQAQPQARQMFYHGMMGNGGSMMGSGYYGNMMDSGSYGHMMGSGYSGGMMGSVQFR